MKTLAKQIAGIPIGMIFCLAMIPTVIFHRIVVVAKLPRGVDNLITKVYAIIEAMTDNAWFPTPSPGLDEVKAATEELKNAQVTAKTRVPGAAKTRNVKKRTLLDIVLQLVMYVQTICLANPQSAVAIAESALLYAKAVKGGVKRIFSVSNCGSRSVALCGSIAGHGCKHEWQMSLTPDDDQSWLLNPIPSTTKAHTKVVNLKSSVKMYFRHRTLSKDGYSEWEGPQGIIVT